MSLLERWLKDGTRHSRASLLFWRSVNRFSVQDPTLRVSMERPWDGLSCGVAADSPSTALQRLRSAVAVVWMSALAFNVWRLTGVQRMCVLAFNDPRHRYGQRAQRTEGGRPNADQRLSA
eukprot:1363897-Rhodomonas_salina.2